MKNKDNVGCLLGFLIVLVLGVIISLIINKTFFTVLGIIGVVIVIVIIAYVMDKNNKKNIKLKNENIYSLGKMTDNLITQTAVGSIERFGVSIPAYYLEEEEGYEETYRKICNRANEIKKNYQCTAIDNEAIDELLKHARNYKDIRMVGELVEADNAFRNANNFEEYSEGKQMIDLKYENISNDKSFGDDHKELVNNVKKQADIDAQWVMRNVIDRMKTDCINQITSLYVNSKSHQQAAFELFVDTIESHRGEFEEETDEFATKAIQEIGHRTGLKSSIYVDEFVEESIEPIDEIDDMEGIAFENVCADILSHNGFNNVEVTQGSGDQGIDVLAEKDGIKYAIQCKRYSTKLGNTPIQEVHAGRKYYKCQIGVVMTNNYFTKGAVELAEETGTLLWDRDKLIEMMEK